jgi:hypothetical protein
MDINQLTRIFCDVDDFCKEFDQMMRKKLLSSASTKRRGPRCSLSDSEIMIILIFFQSSGYRHFKGFYQGLLCLYWHKAFPHLPSYHRFLELMPRVMAPLMLFSQLRMGKSTGFYYIDSSCLPVCHLKRSRRHKTFEAVSGYGRTSVGWFFGLKLHLVINHQGQLVAFKVTPGEQSDIKIAEPLLAKLQGLAFGDKGYIGKKVAQRLLQKGLKLITRVRKNMKQKPATKLEKQLLNQRGIIETVIGYLKFHYQVWHTRHRSIANALTHLLAAIAAYTIEPLSIASIKALTYQPVL